MTIVDWRDVPSDALVPRFACERERWLDRLGWDPEEAWREVELARTSWGLPGVAAIEAGVVRGVTFYLPEHNRLGIGGLFTDGPATTAALLDATLDAGRTFDGIRMFLFDETPSIEPLLRARGFTVARHHYLACAPDAARAAGASDESAADPVSGPRPSRAVDEAGDWPYTPIARLLQASYTDDEAALFAPANQAGEWEHYLRNLVAHTACGVCDPAASRVVWHRGEVRAVMIVTRVGPATAHIAQLAVHPAYRRQGLARRLVRDACVTCAAGGCSVLSLIAADRNVAAGRLYASMAFTRVAPFVEAARR